MLSAALWTIWLGRNEIYFQDTAVDPITLIKLVKIRSFKWIVATVEINSDLELLWNVNPVGAYLLYSKHASKEGPNFWNVDYIGFVDGAWKKDVNNNIVAGIGGLLMNWQKQILFQFSGPTIANSPLEAELKALLFLHDKFLSSSLSGHIHYYTDSMLLYRAYCQAKAGNFSDDPPFDNGDWWTLIKNKKSKALLSL